MRLLFVTFTITLSLLTLISQVSMASDDVSCSSNAQNACRDLRTLTGTTPDTSPWWVQSSHDIIRVANIVIADIDPEHTQEVTKQYITSRGKLEAIDTQMEDARKNIKKAESLFSDIQEVVRENVTHCLSASPVWSACLAITLSGERPRLSLCGSECNEKPSAFVVDFEGKLSLVERFLQEYSIATWGDTVNVHEVRERIHTARTSARHLKELHQIRKDVEKKIYSAIVALTSLLPQPE